MKKVFALILLLLMNFISTNLAQAAIFNSNQYDEDTTISKIYEKSLPAVVLIEAELSDGLSSGTGCIINSNGLILTSSHVVENAPEIDVTISTGEVFKGNVISKMGKDNDLALIKIPQSKEDGCRKPTANGSRTRRGFSFLQGRRRSFREFAELTRGSRQ